MFIDVFLELLIPIIFWFIYVSNCAKYANFQNFTVNDQESFRLIKFGKILRKYLVNYGTVHSLSYLITNGKIVYEKRLQNLDLIFQFAFGITNFHIDINLRLRELVEKIDNEEYPAVPSEYISLSTVNSVNHYIPYAMTNNAQTRWNFIDVLDFLYDLAIKFDTNITVYVENIDNLPYSLVPIDILCALKKRRPIYDFLNNANIGKRVSNKLSVVLNENFSKEAIEWSKDTIFINNFNNNHNNQIIWLKNFIPI